MSSVALARIYQQSFESRPYYTLAVTNGTLNALGDVVAQSVQLLVRPLALIPSHLRLTFSIFQTNSQQNEYQQSTYDPARTIRFFVFGCGMGTSVSSTHDGPDLASHLNN